MTVSRRRTRQRARRTNLRRRQAPDGAPPNESPDDDAVFALAQRLLRETVLDNPFIPDLGGQFPSLPQALFLTVPVLECMYGGAAGGGKSAGMLAAALQYVAHPSYDALILRRSFADLEKPGALIPMSHEWLADTAADWNDQKHRWTFPGGATLSFGHAMNEMTLRTDYKGSAFSFIGFDELTEFSFGMYRFMFSRLRKVRGLPFPLRVRSGTNPNGPGRDWVKARFLDVGDSFPDRMFIPARLEDNPGLDTAEYERSLDELDPVERRQLRHGDWEVRPEGNMFRREWFAESLVDHAENLDRTLRYWDLAATKPKPGHEPDYAAGCKIGHGTDGNFYVLDMRRFRESPSVTEHRVTATANLDGRAVSVRIEQEPGASSKLYIDSLASNALKAYDVRGVRSLLDKPTRARPASSAAERGRIKIVRGPWVEAFLDELCAFPAADFDDQVDAFTGAYNQLAGEFEPWEADDVKQVMGYQYEQ